MICKLTKVQARELGDMIRATETKTEPFIVSAVKHHLAMMMYGVESPEAVIEGLLIACSQNRNDGIANRIDIDELRLLKCEHIFSNNRYSEVSPILEFKEVANEKSS